MKNHLLLNVNYDLGFVDTRKILFHNKEHTP